MRARPTSGSALVALLAAVALMASTGAPAQTRPVEIHGSLDAYAAPGLVLAWGVLRGKDEATTEVVVRVDADPDAYGAVAVAGVDPFTRASQSLLATTPIRGTLEFRSPRSRFADLPRTEWRFYPGAAPAASDMPALLVYYQDIPDTTPEFDDETKLKSYLALRIERARRDARGKP